MPIEFDLDKILHHDRDLTSGYHLMVGRGWRIIGEQEQLDSPLAYSAFEFRCAIERVCFELFVLVKDKRLSKKELKEAKTISGIRKAIYKSCGGRREFERIQVFNRLYSQGTNSPRQIWIGIVDLEVLENFWSQLSNYCHRQLQPNRTWKSLGNKWLQNGYKLLNEVEKSLWTLLVDAHIGWVQPATMQPEVLDARNDFLSGQITQRTLETRLNLMSPVIQKRVHGHY